jgi:hypothetical protein
MFTVTSKEIKIQPVTLKSEDDIISFMADVNAAKATKYEMARAEEKLKQLKESFNGKCENHSVSDGN